MRNQLCIEFLQWALPRLGLCWTGFRKVQGQVCKRIQKRIRELNLPDARAYSAYLEQHPEEWRVLEPLCRVTLSRFYRDKGVFDTLSGDLLPYLAETIQQKGKTVLRIWSAGCASGEEPYTLTLLWNLLLQNRYPDLTLDILGTDIDAALLERARQARYPASALKDLPREWRDGEFAHKENQFQLQPTFRTPVRFVQQDIRRQIPEGPFDLILCRNLVFTYYQPELQVQILWRISEALAPYGALVVGTHEALPEEGDQWQSQAPGIYVKK
jgi:chemotaxis protein methyltransferase CheR